MSIEKISDEIINDSKFSLATIQETTKVLQEEKAAIPTQRTSKETMRMVKANLAQQKNLCNITALPPWEQTAIEKKALQNDPKLKSLIGDEELINIEKNEKGYTVFTKNTRIDVTVKYLPISYCGPAKFEFEFSDATLLEAEASK